ncbi:MAG TPA: outer membrane lipoprotein-sorting protein [Bryobacteraceae bacterium]|nr:outer membrane lipoprotein-sorting protein [Bryobacteraceae bacterium]
MNRRAFLVWTIIGAGGPSLCAATPPSADDVVRRMLEMDRLRSAALHQYTCIRHYFVENERFSREASETVDESYVAPGPKQFKVVSKSGSPFIHRRVIDKLIDAEADAGKKENSDQTHIAPQDYAFQLVGTEQVDGRTCYVLELNPRFSKKYLMKGRIWIDATDYAIVRMDGSPAKNPSLWTRKVHFVRRYEQHGSFWLPSLTESDSDVFIAGESVLKIEYSDYRIDAEPVPPARSGPP